MAARLLGWRTLVLIALRARHARSCDVGSYIYCRHCGAAIMPCANLEHIPSSLASVRSRLAPLAHRVTHRSPCSVQDVRSSALCGQQHASQAFPYPLGPLRLRVEGELEDVEASGATFVPFHAAGNVDGPIVAADPPHACSPLLGAGNYSKALVIVQRGRCTFYDKAKHVQLVAGRGVIVVDNEDGPIAGFTMSGPEQSAIQIPVAIIAKNDGRLLMSLLARDADMKAELGGFDRWTVTAREWRGVMIDPLRTADIQAQRDHSWFAGHNFRAAKCRACGAQIGLAFNESLQPGPRVATDGGDAPAREAFQLPFFHALFLDDIADGSMIRALSKQLRIHPSL